MESYGRKIKVEKGCGWEGIGAVVIFLLAGIFFGTLVTLGTVQFDSVVVMFPGTFVTVETVGML